MAALQLLLLALVYVALVAPQQQQCRVNVKPGVPLLLVNSTNHPPSFVYPDPRDPENVVLNERDEILIACPARTNRASSENIEPGVLLLNGKSLESSSQNVECPFKPAKFANATCHEEPRASHSAILRESTETCWGGKRFEIGYDLEKLGFLGTIELCHDEATARTLWARATIQPVNRKGRNTGRESHAFKVASLYKGMSMGNKGPYELAVAYERLQTILGADGDVDDYLSPEPKARRYLAKGHLIAHADKVYKSEQDSTYFYANVVPMWQAINANPGNWCLVEDYVRRLAESKGRALRVYAGGLGTLNIQGKEFYLAEDGRIPVPKVLFKCVVDDASEEALCFLVANNPYVREDQVEDYALCEKKSICDELLAPTAANASLGYLYCCDVGDFYRATRGELGLEELRAVESYGEMQLLAVDRKIQMNKG